MAAVPAHMEERRVCESVALPEDQLLYVGAVTGDGSMSGKGREARGGERKGGKGGRGEERGERGEERGERGEEEVRGKVG